MPKLWCMLVASSTRESEGNDEMAESHPCGSCGTEFIVARVEAAYQTISTITSPSNAYAILGLNRSTKRRKPRQHFVERPMQRRVRAQRQDETDDHHDHRAARECARGAERAVDREDQPGNADEERNFPQIAPPKVGVRWGGVF